MGVLSNNYAQIVPGALISASYVSDIYEVLMGAEPEALKVTGSLTVTGSVIATSGVIASLQGTASFAVTASRAVSALTASYALSASYLNYINTSSQADTATTASYAIIANQANSSSTATTASYALTASYVVNSISSSLADTSSYAPTYINTASIAGSTVTFTKGNGDQFNISIPGGSVNYANVYFVDSTNGNNSTAVVNDFTKAYLTVATALSASNASSPTTSSQALVYVRKGLYNNEAMSFYNQVNVYCEPGVYFSGSSHIHDNGNSVTARFMGYAQFNNNQDELKVFKSTGDTSDIYFECDEIIARGGAYETQNGTNVYFKIRRADTETIGFGEGMFLAGSGTRVIEISQEYKSAHQNFKIISFSGKAVITCPRIYLKSTNYYGGNYKQAIMCEANGGGEVIVNGDLISDPSPDYYGGISGMITRWNNSWLTLRLNGSIFSENQLGINAQGSSAASRTIINGDVRSNLQIAYIASNSRVVFRNGTLMNWNLATASIANQYPIIHVNQNSVTFIENCHLHNLGTSSYSAIWKTSTTSDLNVYNTIYSGADASGSFIKNTAVGVPTNSVRLHNVRSTKNLDTNITDLLSPTGFIHDTNITSINFI